MENEDRPLLEIFNQVFRNLKRAEKDEGQGENNVPLQEK